jgi:hypothetical protein
MSATAIPDTPPKTRGGAFLPHPKTPLFYAARSYIPAQTHTRIMDSNKSNTPGTPQFLLRVFETEVGS